MKANSIALCSHSGRFLVIVFNLMKHTFIEAPYTLYVDTGPTSQVGKIIAIQDLS